MPTHFLISTSHTGKNMERTEMFIDRKWINKLWYMDYYMEVKMNELGLYTETKMDLRISVE